MKSTSASPQGMPAKVACETITATEQRHGRQDDTAAGGKSCSLQYQDRNRPADPGSTWIGDASLSRDACFPLRRSFFFFFLPTVASGPSVLLFDSLRLA